MVVGPEKENSQILEGSAKQSRWQKEVDKKRLLQACLSNRQWKWRWIIIRESRSLYKGESGEQFLVASWNWEENKQKTNIFLSYPDFQCAIFFNSL